MSTVATPRKSRKPAAKPARSVQLYNASGNPMLLEMTIGKESFAYFVKKIHADYGMGFEFTKCPDCVGPSSDDVYHVHYDPARKSSSCDCLGGLHHGHCKHQESIVALIQSGKIEVSATNPAPQQPAKKEPWCSYCNDVPGVYCSHCSI
jgi:hypothetical protein